MKTALVLFAHGARDPEWSFPFRKIQQRLTARCPGVSIELAFLESTPPRLDEVLDRLAAGGFERITIAPLFMAPGGHLRHDLPRLLNALRARHPGLRLDVLETVGEVDAVLDAISDWLSSAVQGPPRTAP